MAMTKSWQDGWQDGWQVGWLVGSWLAGWLSWLVGWLATPTNVGKVRGSREVYIAPVVPVGNQVVLRQRLLHTLLTPRTLVRSAQYLTTSVGRLAKSGDFEKYI